MSTPREDPHAPADGLPDPAAHRSWFGAVAGSEPGLALRSEQILRTEFGRRP